jgi:hypothetical protein
MKKFLILLFLVSCTAPVSDVKLDKKKLNFNDDLSLKDFKEMLIEYVKISPYPNID